MQHDDFRRAIEAIKLRAPIEELVRERVPGLKKAGSLWVACCPFHDEKTPSFKVDPRRGTWHCFGACSTGGDQFRFLERIDNLPFLDALEILAARTGVELPRASRQANEAANDATERARTVLAKAVAFYRAQLGTPEGARAREYLRGRGLTDRTSEQFSAGYSPANGQAFVQLLRNEGVDLGAAESAGLVRRADDGRPYDFFRGRLMIPIFDARGRPVGFGARRLADDDAAGPKYINTPETELFRKGSLVYALDRALPSMRREGRAVLVEGYTDVMAAHQVGLTSVVAVLGTATTEDHAALLKKSGARRVTLVFDGDEAGRKAAHRALPGLVPYDFDIDVVALPAGQDPCDVVVQSGAAPLIAAFDLARPWLDFAAEDLRAKRGADLSREVDRLLELLGRVAKPVQRESLLADLAAQLAIPVEALREQARALIVPARAARKSAPQVATPIAAPGAPTEVDARLVRAFEGLVGALLCDASLVPLARPYRERCPDTELARIFDVVLELFADEDAHVDLTAVIDALAGDPLRDRVAVLYQREQTAESPRASLQGNIRYIQSRSEKLARLRVQGELAARERTLREADGGDAAVHDPIALELSRRARPSGELSSSVAGPNRSNPSSRHADTHHG